MPRAGTPPAPAVRRTRRAGAAAAPSTAATTTKRPGPPVLGPLQPDAAIAAYLEALDHGQPWYDALLEVIARWVAPDEDAVDGAPRSYLIGGEAFDWLSLAERLISAAGTRVPTAEAERLLFHGEPPDGADEEAFARAIGPQKHRAHLNFQYGVVVEETLLLAAELDLVKARTVDGPRDQPADIRAYDHVYGKPLTELMTLYRSETSLPLSATVRQHEWQAFTYWCSKYRFRTGEPARVASDTRKALALLSRLHAERARPNPVPEDAAYIDLIAYRANDA